MDLKEKYNFIFSTYFFTNSWHAQLSLNLAMMGSLSIIVAQHMYSMPPYGYLATDYGTQLSIFTHHMWIGGFCIVGAAAHAAIFMVRDYDPTTNYKCEQVLSIISILCRQDWKISNKS